MRHVLLIDPLDKLVIKKDSTLLLALTLKERGHEVALCFESDFSLTTKTPTTLRVFDFEGSFEGNGPYLSSFKLTSESRWNIEKDSIDYFHMRLDPPFDTRYLRILWMLEFLERKGIVVMNSAKGLLQFNEKMEAYAHPSSLSTFVGRDAVGFRDFVSAIVDKKSTEAIILKPLDLYQGYGVEKVMLNQSLDTIVKRFEEKCIELGGALVAQEFDKNVEKGEVRSLYFKGKELGSILKIPKKGEFLANIAQGAAFEKIELTKTQKQACDEITKRLCSFGVDWVAFDILGEHVSEVNITCPGLLVEVSKAMGKNLAHDIIDLL